MHYLLASTGRSERPKIIRQTAQNLSRPLDRSRDMKEGRERVCFCSETPMSLPVLGCIG